MQHNSPFSIIFLLLATFLFAWFSLRKTTPPVTDNILIVGTNAEYPPFTFIDNGTIVGLDIDIIKEVAHRLDKPTLLKDMSFDSLLPKLQFGDIQVIAAGLTATPEKAKNVLFTKPYISGDPLIVISMANNPPITHLRDLDGKQVVVNEGYTADQYMSTIQGPIVKRLATPTEGFLALTSGHSYAFIAAQSSVKPYFDKHGKTAFNIFTLDGVHDSYSLAVSKQHPELLTAIQNALDAMEKDNTLASIKAKWGFA
ncbi:MAG TPA: ABC transporter substrate-binding protein [Candidatus Babeliales bacterium]|nr:ABC transporter substrate-binding protein [Candidatus Babeliales bacterium]